MSTLELLTQIKEASSTEKVEIMQTNASNPVLHFLVWCIVNDKSLSYVASGVPPEKAGDPLSMTDLSNVAAAFLADALGLPSLSELDGELLERVYSQIPTGDDAAYLTVLMDLLAGDFKIGVGASTYAKVWSNDPVLMALPVRGRSQIEALLGVEITALKDEDPDEVATPPEPVKAKPEVPAAAPAAPDAHVITAKIVGVRHPSYTKGSNMLSVLLKGGKTQRRADVASDVADLVWIRRGQYLGKDHRFALDGDGSLQLLTT